MSELTFIEDVLVRLRASELKAIISFARINDVHSTHSCVQLDCTITSKPEEEVIRKLDNNCTMVFDIDLYTRKGKEFSLLQVFERNKEEFDLGNRVFITMKVNELNND